MKIKSISLLLLVVISLAIAAPVLAQEPIYDFTNTETQNKVFLQKAGLGTTNISVVVSSVIKILLSFLGVLFVVLIVYAGFLWMTAAGAEDQISKAKSIMTAAVIGLAIVLSAYAITYYVLDQVIESTKGGGHGLD